MLGSGGIMVINDQVSIPKLAYRAIRFYAHESCGQCIPCKEGSHVIKALLKKVLNGSGKHEDLQSILSICKNVKGLTLCPTGDAFAIPIETMINKYRDEFDKLIKL